MKRILAVMSVVCLLLLHSQAQTTSSVSGTVQDPTGNAIVAAQVKITNVDTNAERAAVTNGSGVYEFTNLAVGTYSLQVSAAGFESYVQKGIVLEINTNPAINVVMTVGAVTQEVEVQANAVAVEMQSTGVGQVINPQQVIDLPLNGRQANQLILLSGGAVQNNTGSLAINLDYPNAVAISVNGAQGNGSNYYLDGAINMAVRTNVGLPMPFPDALQEFKVESSAMPANYGIRPGGTVTASTKPGTNKFHGDLFEFFRNTDMDAHLAFTGAPDNLKRNQFGGVIGGPIKKDKLFFFSGFQGTTERIQNVTTTSFVPTTATLNGDFTAMLAAPCQAKPITLNSAYVTSPGSNVIQPGLLTTSSAAIAAKYATNYLPPATNACGLVNVTPLTHDNEFQGVGRVDWQRTANDSLFTRYYVSNYYLLPYEASHNILSAINPGLADQVQSFVIGDTYIINSRTISAPRVYFTRSAVDRIAPSTVPNWQELGSNVTAEYKNYMGNSSVTGYWNFSDPSFPGYDYENTYAASEDIGMTLHAHQVNFGFVWMHNQMNTDALSNVDPAISFASGTSSVTGSPLADFITGNPSSFHQANGQLGRDGQNLPSFYVQDNWKLKPNFQLNLGLRWDPYIASHTKYGAAEDFSPAAFAANKVSSQFVNAPPGLTFPGDSGFHGTSDTNNHMANFAPRVGIVWDPRGKGTESIRAGYGIFYDTSIMWNPMVVVLDPPYGSSITFTPQTVANGGGLANPWNGSGLTNPFPTPLKEPSNYAFPVNGSYSLEEQNIASPYTQEWDLSIQDQLAHSWLLTATYVGNKGTHQWGGINLMQAMIIPASQIDANGGCTLNYLGQALYFNPCNGPTTESVNGINNENARKALVLQNPLEGPKFTGGLTQNASTANSAYNGVVVSAEHRMSHEFSILANYTYSHCLDMFENGENVSATYQNPANPRGDWGNCNSDRRQVVNVSFELESPKFGSRPLEMIAGGWHLSGIYTATAGAWLNVTDGSDVSLSGVGQDRPNKVGNPLQGGAIAANPGCTAPAAVKTIAHWFNPCAYQKQTSETFGNTHRDDLLGPGNWNYDSALWKNFNIREGISGVFRVESFNLFNHFITNTPASTSLSTGNVGAVTTASTNDANRLLQLALKVIF